MEEQKKTRKTTNQVKLIKAFLKDTSKCRWPVEVKAANQLIKLWNFEFLMELEGRIKLNSLLWFIGPEGRSYLNDIKRYQGLFSEKKHIQLEEKPVAPPTEYKPQVKTLKDFLKIK